MAVKFDLHFHNLNKILIKDLSLSTNKGYMKGIKLPYRSVLKLCFSSQVLFSNKSLWQVDVFSVVIR